MKGKYIMTLKIGSIIKELRIKNKVTQDQLATFIGVTPQAISRWEAESGYPDIELLPSIAEYFSVSADDLLGINRSEKEKRLAEIYDEIKKQGELGTGKESIPYARQILAEFPSNEKIQINLANTLCRAYMWNESPNTEALKEAEKIYLTVIENTNDADFRNEVIEKLCALYAHGYRDEFKTEQTAALLPTMRYCREAICAHVFKDFQSNKDLLHRQDYIEQLTDSLGCLLTNYIVECIPNDSSMWDQKIAMLEWIIALYKYIFGEELLFYHDRVATLYRFIATYLVAQKKYDETLSCLEKMCDHQVAYTKAQLHTETSFQSPFTNQLYYPNDDRYRQTAVHNQAWYTLNTKLTQKRYDPIREDIRFQEVERKLSEIMK